VIILVSLARYKDSWQESDQVGWPVATHGQLCGSLAPSAAAPRSCAAGGRPTSAPLSSPDHLPLYKGGDVRAQAPGGDEVPLPSEEIFQEKGQVHEVVEGGLHKLHEDVDVACLLLLTPSVRAEDPDPLYIEPSLDLVLVSFRIFNAFIRQSPPKSSFRFIF